MSWVTDSGSNVVNNNPSVAKTSSASQSGTRAGRIVRLVRLVRLVRMAKLYKYMSQALDFAWTYLTDMYERYMHGTKAGDNAIRNRLNGLGNGKNGVENPQEEDLIESRVGAAMSDLTNRRVIVLVLLIIIVVPFLNPVSDDNTALVATNFIYNFYADAYQNSSSPLSTWSSKGAHGIDIHSWPIQDSIILAKKFASPIIKIIVQNQTVSADYDKLSSLRDEEMTSFFLNDYNVTLPNQWFEVAVTFDLSSESRKDALYSIYTTIYIIALLLGGTLIFSYDVNRLVIGPIEKMVFLVRQISADPLGVDYKISMGEKDGFLAGMETTVLLATITKIGALMRVGFGEAGATVIAKNLDDSSGGRLNLIGAGVMISSIFGFCDVRQFTDTTECLQEEVMLFVNRIAHILHGIVDKCSGAANKNIGDAFLLTWKLEDDYSSNQVTDLADQALLTFCKALIEICRHQSFICNFSVAATQRLFKRFPQYAVRIGSGLHVGWAIEGAIGSGRKIDATYLSPHVNFTEYLESSTKAYGVPLLISEPFYRMLSSNAARLCRQVDRIRKSAKEEPMNIYTYDSDLNIDWNSIKPKGMQSIKAPPKRASLLAVMYDLQHHRTKEKEKEKDTEAPPHHETRNDAPVAAPEMAITTPYNIDIWDEDHDLVELRHLVSEEMMQHFATGMEAYIAGEWGKAIKIFQETNLMGGGNDGPSLFLLSEMEPHVTPDGRAPPSWQGYRDDSGGGH